MDKELFRAMGAGLMLLGIVFTVFDCVIVLIYRKQYQALKELWNQDNYLSQLDPKLRDQVECARHRYQQFTSHKFRKAGVGLVVLGLLIVFASKFD